MSEEGIYQEWRTHNSQRRFPFADDASLVGNDGFVLPDEVFIDGFFYPINISEPLYLSSLDMNTRLVKISSGNRVVGTGTISESTDTIQFLDDYDRHVGTLVFTDILLSISGSVTFTSNSAQFAPACVMPQNQPGVRGFLMPDGTLLTGEITFSGEDGVVIDSRIEDDYRILRISAVGVQEPPACVDLPPPLVCIDVNQLNGGSLVIGRIGNRITIGHRAALADTCYSQELLIDDDGNLPLTPEDPCDPDTPEECDPNPPWDPPGPCPENQQFYFIDAGGDLLSIRPYLSEELAGSALLDYIYNPLLPPRQTQGIIISLRNGEQ